MLDRNADPPLTPGFALVWGFAPPSRRGPKPGHSVRRIIEAAMDLAGEEGYAALSLPKIARRLGLTANALYRYIDSRDELLLLLFDAGCERPPESLPRGANWRDGAAGWVRALYDRYLERPWLLDIPIRGAPVTPNLLAWLEALLGVFEGSGIGEGDRLSCAVLLDGYARSSAALTRDLRESSSAPVQSAKVTEFLLPLLHERGYPILAGMLAGGGYADSPGPDVDFGLERILDGIEVRIAGNR